MRSLRSSKSLMMSDRDVSLGEKDRNTLKRLAEYRSRSAVVLKLTAKSWKNLATQVSGGGFRFMVHLPRDAADYLNCLTEEYGKGGQECQSS